MFSEKQTFNLGEIRTYLEFIAFDCESHVADCDSICPYYELCRTISGEDQRRLASDTIKLIDALDEQIQKEHALAEFNLKRWQHWRELAETLNRDLNRVNDHVEELEELLQQLEKGE